MSIPGRHAPWKFNGNIPGVVSHTHLTLLSLSVRYVALADALTVPDGGFTVDPATGADVSGGFAVSIDPACERIIRSRVGAADILAYVTDTIDMLSLPGRALGGWRDPASGSAFLDVSVIVADRATALTLGREHNQISVYDFAANATVPISVLP